MALALELKSIALPLVLAVFPMDRRLRFSHRPLQFSQARILFRLRDENNP
jgi:hypothetical protein